MNPYDCIQKGLAYMEGHLKTDISPRELAEAAGYSLYHYLRLFSAVCGMPFAEYLLKRRLAHAIDEIARGRKAIDVVLEYGFATYAGFYKAFVRCYGCSPKRYCKIYGAQPLRPPEVRNLKTYTRYELKSILSHWQIPKNTPLEPVLLKGQESMPPKIWRIGESCLLQAGERVAQMRTLAFSEALNNREIRVPTPIPTNTGAAFLESDDIFILYRAVAGKRLETAVWYTEEGKALAASLGLAIAKLHRALLHIQLELPVDTVDLHQDVMAWALPEVKQQNQQWHMGLTPSFFADYEKNAAALFPLLPRQWIHRNCCPDSLRFDSAHEVGFVGFDGCEENARLFDPCYAATAILSETQDVYQQEKWLTILSRILKAYNQENALTPEEKQAVYYMLCAIQMLCIAWFGKREAYRALAKINRDMLKQIADKKEQIMGIW